MREFLTWSGIAKAKTVTAAQQTCAAATHIIG